MWLRRVIGLMPPGYSILEGHQNHTLLYKGYRCGLAHPSKRRLKELSWQRYRVEKQKNKK